MSMVKRFVHDLHIVVRNPMVPVDPRRCDLRDSEVLRDR